MQAEWYTVIEIKLFKGPVYMDSYLGYFILLFLAVLLYLAVLLGVIFFTSSISLNIIKSTLGKNIKNQITKKHRRKIFAFTIISYLISIFSLFIMFVIAKGEF